jgi:hypothetical protein
MHRSSRRHTLIAVVLLLVPGATPLARTAPSLTVINNAREDVLVRVVGPVDGYFAVAAAARRVVPLSAGTYGAFFRWGATRYRYSRLEEPFTIRDNERIELTLNTAAGNVAEEPSDAEEFSSGRSSK